MRKVTSLDEYYALVKAAKAERKAAASNCFLFPDAIQRLIGLGRFYCEELDVGVLFYSDEEQYYEGYYYLDSDAPLHIEKKDKPVVIQNMRPGTEKKARLLRIEQRLIEAGFAFSDTMQMLKADPKHVLDKIAPLSRYAKKALDRDGFRFGRVTEKQLPAFWGLVEAAKEIPYYTLAYYNEDEILEQIEKGWLTCITDREGNICAAHHFFAKGKSLFGWLAVQEAYKKLYGMALVFTEDVLRYAIDNDYLISGWIDLKNDPSIQYHQRVGYQFVDRYSDRWILTAK